MHDIELSGLDGSNLLAYLAALGTLRVLTATDNKVRLSWREKDCWTPVIHHPHASNPEELLEFLAPRLCGPQTINAAWTIGDNLTFSPEEFARLLNQAVCKCTPGECAESDFFSAFGSDAFATGPKKQIGDTALRTMSGAGHQHFLASMRELAERTERGHLRRSLFEAWDYADDRPSLRWDPADYRPHALRAEDPSGDPIRTMRGANRLAVEALPLFATAPRTRSLSTVSFTETRDRTEMTWPIWVEPLDLDTVRSLLSLEQLQAAEPDGLRCRGIAQAYRVQRFTEGKYRNFTPARTLL